MAGRANGFDLSEANIIVDFMANKNTPSRWIVLYSCEYIGLNFNRESDLPC
jgi:hypothetical protein